MDEGTVPKVAANHPQCVALFLVNRSAETTIPWPSMASSAAPLRKKPVGDETGDSGGDNDQPEEKADCAQRVEIADAPVMPVTPGTGIRRRAGEMADMARFAAHLAEPAMPRGIILIPQELWVGFPEPAVAVPVAGIRISASLFVLAQSFILAPAVIGPEGADFSIGRNNQP